MYTAGPWSAGDFNHHETLVNSKDYPIASVFSGDWGDEFPNVRLVKNERAMGECAEAFIETIVYGHIDESTAQSNANLIAAAPDLLDACTRALELLEVLETECSCKMLCPPYDIHNVNQTLRDVIADAIRGRPW